MSNRIFAGAFVLGLAAALWVGLGFLGTNSLALAVSAAILATYFAGSNELRLYRAATRGLAGALEATAQPPADLEGWLSGLPATLREPVRLRVETARGGLPAPALTPYLAGLLVSLGMLGTFLGMVLTFRGAVFALEGSADLQAMRAALSEPIRGLGLAFGTSVAGVATSAMLGLMAAVARRERLDVSRALDRLSAGPLQSFSSARQRQDALRGLQDQGAALPEVASQLGALALRLDERHESLARQLAQSQERFFQEASQSYAGLAERVAGALGQGLAAGSQAASEAMQSMARATLERVEAQALATQARSEAMAAAQVESLSARFGATAQAVASGWREALAQHAQAGQAQAGQLSEALQGFRASFEGGSAGLLSRTQEEVARLLEGAQRQADQLLAGSQQQLRQAVQAHEAQLAALQAQVPQLFELAKTQMDQLLATSQAQLAQALAASQAQFAQVLEGAHAQMGRLREEEAARGELALQRLGALEAAVAGHLGTLGQSLEAPLARLLQTAAEVPQAGAEMLARLRQEMSALAERDQVTLQERTVLLERLGALVDALQQSTGEQQLAVQSLTRSARDLIEEATGRFESSLQAQSVEASRAGARLEAGAIELSGMAEAFGAAMQQFQAGNEKLLGTLQQVEAALERSAARSDEQLAYYVAQAREVVDLSIASQQGLLESLREATAARRAPRGQAPELQA